MGTSTTGRRHGGSQATSLADSPKLRELGDALSTIGVTKAHKSVALLIVIGALFDNFGLVGLFAMIAVMYGVFAACVQFGPETRASRWKM